MHLSNDMLVLREMVAWAAENSGAIQLHIAITPDTVVRLVRRARSSPAATSPGWVTSHVRLRDVRPGDFATVTTREGRSGAAALSIEIMRSGG
jgi:hypothetical protein